VFGGFHGLPGVGFVRKKDGYTIESIHEDHDLVVQVVRDAANIQTDFIHELNP
jgi:hypothetical protein